MPARRRIAAMFDADQLGLREREILRGIAAHAQAAGWRLVVDPFAIHRPAGRWDGLLVRTRKGLARALMRSPVPFVCVGTFWSIHSMDSGLPFTRTTTVRGLAA